MKEYRIRYEMTNGLWHTINVLAESLQDATSKAGNYRGIEVAYRVVIEEVL